MTTMTATVESAAAAYDRRRTEATAIATRIAEHLVTAPYPAALDWGDTGSMAHYAEELRRISDAMFHEGEHAE
jgi:hypothetical protein